MASEKELIKVAKNRNWNSDGRIQFEFNFLESNKIAKLEFSNSQEIQTMNSQIESNSF